MAQQTYEWKAVLACIATYKVLEADDNLDQFEEHSIPFAKAPDVKMGALRYYPKTTANADIIQVLSFEIARKFVKLLVKQFSVSKQKKDMTSAGIITAIAGIFNDKDKTIRELAEVVDDEIKFSDE